MSLFSLLLLISVNAFAEIPAPDMNAHTTEQLRLEEEFSQKILEMAHQMRNIRSKMNRLSNKDQFVAVRDSLRTASGNRSVAETHLRLLKTCDTKDWEMRKNKLELAIEELQAAISRANQKL